MFAVMLAAGCGPQAGGEQAAVGRRMTAAARLVSKQYMYHAYVFVH